jgi:hypothetical protein
LDWFNEVVRVFEYLDLLDNKKVKEEAIKFKHVYSLGGNRFKVQMTVIQFGEEQEREEISYQI